jgi:hypothetical protein
MNPLRLCGDGRPLRWNDAIESKINWLDEMLKTRPSVDSPEHAVWRHSFARARILAARAFACSQGWALSDRPFEFSVLASGSWPRVLRRATRDFMWANSTNPIAIIVHLREAFPGGTLPPGVTVDEIRAWRPGERSYVIRKAAPVEEVVL